MKICLKSIFVLFFLLLFSSVLRAELTDEAERIYDQLRGSLYQIRVVDRSTGEKTSIGSGFQISADGFVATNFHVVSQAVHYPKKYILKYVDHENREGVADILDVDVVHDLALIKIDQPGEKFCLLGDSDKSKGTRVFAMGNPFDLGLTIIEGLYNGLMKKTMYKKVLFSGSLNPGMSGGPAMDIDGKVFGVNVSTAGNQISFFVPVEYLKDLVESVNNRNGVAIEDWPQHMERQLLKNQQTNFDRLLDAEWNKAELQEVSVPGEMMDAFKCWSETYDIEDNMYEHTDVICSSEDNLYLSPSLVTGQISYQYTWLKSVSLDPFRFYNFIEEYFSSSYFTNAGKKDVSNFQCRDSFVESNNQTWKGVICARYYKKFPKIFDVMVKYATVGFKDKTLIVNVDLLGVDKDDVSMFLTKFLGEIRWTN